MITIPLSRGYVAIVDDEDVHLAQHRWFASQERRKRTAIYAMRNVLLPDGRRRTVRLHRVIMNAPPGVEVDHVDGDGLNCRRSNLRLATRQQNACNCPTQLNNTSGARGVSRVKRDGKWHAYVNVARKRLTVGYFKSKEEAVRARDLAAQRLHGEFARLNAAISST